MIRLSQEHMESSHRVQHALEVLAETVMLRADLATVVSEGRGFLIGGTDESERGFNDGVRLMHASIERLRGLVAANAAQAEAVDRLALQIRDRVDFLRQVMDLARSRDRDGVLALALTQRGRDLTDQILAGVSTIEDEERRLFRSRLKASNRAERWLVMGLVGCGVFGAASALLVGAMWIGRHRERAHVAELNASAAERRRSEAALRESEAKFRAMAETMPTLLFETDPGGRYIYCNSAHSEYAGLTLAQTVGDGRHRFVHPDDLERASQTWVAAMRTGSLYEVEYRLQRHDGVFRWFLCRAVPVRDAAGAITRWIGIATDIDDQKRAGAVLAQHRDDLERLVAERTSELAASEAELRETATRFRMLAEHSSDLVTRTGPDERLLYASPACERIFGVPGEALTRDLYLSRVHPEDRPALMAARPRLFGGVTETEVLVYRVLHPDGRTLWVESAATSLRHPVTGAPDGCISIIRDVTERRLLEERLRHAQKMEAIGRISAGVAHDFNNILQTVIGSLELTLDSIERNEPARGFAALALDSANRGSSLTHHLLAYARKQVLQPRLLELRPFLADMQRLLARTLGRHIDVQIDVACDLPPVRVDPNQLQTALLNLAINGAHAMGEGGVLTIGAKLVEQEAEQKLVALRIADTGVGMDAATLAQACEPFFSTKGPDGTGLGLSMVQGFAEQSGGRFWIESILCVGTTVHLLFPAAKGEVRRPPDIATLPQPSRRVLVVDDEPDLLVTAGAFLERAGLWVTRAGSGDEALAMLAGDVPFDAVVTDYAMPGMNGAALAVECQSIRPGLPVLIVTGYAEVHGIEDLPGHIRVLHKPFLREHLLRSLRQVMLVRGEADPASGPGARPG